MDKPTFKNRPNPVHRVGDRDVYESRSAAVVAVILGVHKDSIYVLAEKRSNKMDSPGKWCLVSGYMDWDEDGLEAITRETYEETSLYLPKFANQLIFDNDGEPWHVRTNPQENRQNITLNFIFIYDFQNGPPRYVENYHDSETDQIKWIEISQVFNGQYDWAFNHDERIEMAIKKFQNYLA